MSLQHSSTTADANVDLVRRFATKVWNERDYGAIAELVHPEYVRYEPGTPDPIRGREGLERHVREMERAFPDFVIEPHLALGESDTVLAHYTVRGTHDGAFGPLAPTGRRVVVDGTSVIRFEDGMMREEHVCYDSEKLREQLGATGIGLLRQLPSIVRWNVRNLRARRSAGPRR